MIISYLGHSCFVLKGEYSICIDPYQNIGYDLPEIKTDYYYCSHNHYDHNAYQKSMGKNALYDDKFTKIKTFHDEKKGNLRGENLVLSFKTEGIKFTHLGDLGESENLDLIEKIKDTDVLFIPVGGNYTINYKQALKYVEKINAKIIIPMHYKFGKSAVDIDGVENFLREASNFTIEKKDSPIKIELPLTGKKIITLKAEV